MLADIARQIVAANPDVRWTYSAYDRLGELAYHGTTGRRPTSGEAAFVKARDGTCRAPGCRRAASGCELDHTLDWAKGGHSARTNIAALCTKHHRYKHSPGVELLQLSPGVLGWTTPTGLQYVTTPQPYPDE